MSADASIPVPNLRPGHHHNDLDGGERCAGHCIHVGFMWRDFKRMEKAFIACFIAILIMLVKDVYPAFRSRGRETTAVIHGGERIATDRVPEPNE